MIEPITAIIMVYIATSRINEYNPTPKKHTKVVMKAIKSKSRKKIK